MGRHGELSKTLERQRLWQIPGRNPGNTFATPGYRDMRPDTPLAGGLPMLEVLTHCLMPGTPIAILATRVAGRI